MRDAPDHLRPYRRARQSGRPGVLPSGRTLGGPSCSDRDIPVAQGSEPACRRCRAFEPRVCPATAWLTSMDDAPRALLAGGGLALGLCSPPARPLRPPPHHRQSGPTASTTEPPSPAPIPRHADLSTEHSRSIRHRSTPYRSRSRPDPRAEVRRPGRARRHRHPGRRHRPAGGDLEELRRGRRPGRERFEKLGTRSPPSR